MESATRMESAARSEQTRCCVAWGGRFAACPAWRLQRRAVSMAGAAYVANARRIGAALQHLSGAAGPGGVRGLFGAACATAGRARTGSARRVRRRHAEPLFGGAAEVATESRPAARY